MLEKLREKRNVIEFDGHESTIISLLAQCGKIEQDHDFATDVRRMLKELPKGPKRQLGECLVGWNGFEPTQEIESAMKGLRRWVNSLDRRDQHGKRIRKKR